MSKQAIAAIAIVALVVIGSGAYLATRNSSDTNSSAQNQTTNTTPSSTSSSSESSTATANTVEIKDMAFTPASITVKKGTTVTWTNKDGVEHDVVETDGKTGPKSDLLANGKSYSFTYDTVGTFAYHCSVHPSMTGTVIVTE